MALWLLNEPKNFTGRVWCLMGTVTRSYAWEMGHAVSLNGPMRDTLIYRACAMGVSMPRSLPAGLVERRRSGL